MRRVSGEEVAGCDVEMTEDMVSFLARARAVVIYVRDRHLSLFFGWQAASKESKLPDDPGETTEAARLQMTVQLGQVTSCHSHRFSFRGRFHHRVM
jgi:hypothetical protein